jgi:hypothetical protein
MAPSADSGLPYFLWDVQQRQTVLVEELREPPEYIRVSHTWGRWLPGVPWLVPPNSKFEVRSLPAEVERAFASGYVWLDPLCIPRTDPN